MYNANARIRSVERPNLFIVKTSTSLTRRICLMFKIVLKVAVVSFTLMTSVSLSLIKQFRSLSILEVTGGFAPCKFPPTALRVHPLTESEFALTFTSLPQIFGFSQQNLFLLCLNHNMYQITCYFFAMANMTSTVANTSSTEMTSVNIKLLPCVFCNNLGHVHVQSVKSDLTNLLKGIIEIHYFR